MRREVPPYLSIFLLNFSYTRKFEGILSLRMVPTVGIWAHLWGVMIIYPAMTSRSEGIGNF